MAEAEKLYKVEYTGAEVVTLGKAGKFMPGTSAYLREDDARDAAARGDFVVHGLDGASASASTAPAAASKAPVEASKPPVAAEKKAEPPKAEAPKAEAPKAEAKADASAAPAAASKAPAETAKPEAKGP